MEIINNNDNIKKTKTFKEYYQDEAFRERHKNYIMTKIKCECGQEDVLRCNMSKHKKTQKHIKLMETVNKEKHDKELSSLIELLEKKIDELKIKKISL